MRMMMMMMRMMMLRMMMRMMMRCGSQAMPSSRLTASFVKGGITPFLVLGFLGRQGRRCVANVRGGCPGSPCHAIVPRRHFRKGWLVWQDRVTGARGGRQCRAGCCPASARGGPRGRGRRGGARRGRGGAAACAFPLYANAGRARGARGHAPPVQELVPGLRARPGGQPSASQVAPIRPRGSTGCQRCTSTMPSSGGPTRRPGSSPSWSC